MDNPRVNRPESGAYGEKADLQNLRQSLPPMQPQPQAPGQPAPAPSVNRPQRPPQLPTNPVGRPQGATPPPGLPPSMAHPGTGMSGSGYMDPAAQMQSLPSDQRTIFLLDMLASSPEVSPDTREWAGTVLNILLDNPESMANLI